MTKTIAHARSAGLSLPLPPLDDEALERLLIQIIPHHSVRTLPQPDWHFLHDELVSRKNLTLMLLWQDYKDQQPESYHYSYFCDLCRHWLKRVDQSLRQEQPAGENLFVDYCGQTLPIADPTTEKFTRPRCSW